MHADAVLDAPADGAPVRRTGFLELLAARRAERESSRVERRATAAVARGEGSDAGTAGAAAGFDADFAAGAQALERALAVDAPSSRAGGEAPFAMTAEAAADLHARWSNALGELQALLNAAAPSLAPFDVRKAQSRITVLAAAVEEARGRVQPRNRFRFSRRRAAGSLVTATAAIEASQSSDESRATSAARGFGFELAVAAATRAGDDSGKSLDCSTTTTSRGGSDGTAPQQDRQPADDDEFVVAGLAGMTITVLSGPRPPAGVGGAARPHTAAAAGDGSGGGGHSVPLTRVFDFRGGERDVRLAALTDCTVLVRGVTRALRVDGLTRVALCAGPVAGSVLLHGATACTFMLAARQLRAHTSTECAFYLAVHSRPIIEGCTRLAFAPYRLRYDGWAADARAAWLDDGGGGGGAGVAAPAAAAAGVDSLWCAVDDFGWHRVQQSPNWRVLAPAERIDVEGGLSQLRLPLGATLGGMFLEPVEPAAAAAVAVGTAAGGEDEF